MYENTLSVYKPPFTMTDEMTVLISEIREEIGRISVFLEGPSTNHLFQDY